MNKAFVTGGSGFVGRNLIRGLRDRGIGVAALARSDEAVRKVETEGAAAVRGDLEDREALASGMAGCDAVFHAAAKVELWGDPADFHRINVEGTQNVIDAARAAGVPRLVHVSTEALLAGGRPIVDADESWPYPKRPAGLYPLSKGIAEKRAIAANGNGLETIAVRPPLIWGAGDTSVLPQLAAAVRAGQWMWFGGGNYPHTTTHVRNVVEGLVLAAERGRGGEVYFIADPELHLFRPFITALLETQGVDPGTKSIPLWLGAAIAGLTEPFWRVLRLKGSPPLPRSVLYLMGQKLTVKTGKARRELGYQGHVTFEQGLAEMKAASEG